VVKEVTFFYTPKQRLLAVLRSWWSEHPPYQSIHILSLNLCKVMLRPDIIHWRQGTKHQEDSKNIQNFLVTNWTLFFNFRAFLNASFRLPPVKTPAHISFTDNLTLKFVTNEQIVSASKISHIKYIWMPFRIYEYVINVTSSFLSGRSLSRCFAQTFKLYSSNADCRLVVTL
jgi:hypothetical protein